MAEEQQREALEKTESPTDVKALGARLNEAFPNAPVSASDDAGALLVQAEELIDVCNYLKDTPDLAYDYLSNLTCVDWLDDGYFEVVYDLYSVEKGHGPLELKVRTDGREQPRVPSVISVWAGADFQEREVWDLYGVRFPGHPNLKRILTWEGFHGHPMRKDWHEAYYEQDDKPFDSRWPKGEFFHGEDKLTRWGKNVDYPRGWEPTTAGGARPGEETAVIDVGELKGGGVRTDTFVVNMGPQHPSTHGVFQMRVTLDGETVVDLEPVMGFLHRNHEQIGERNLWLGNMPYTDRLDYICSMSNNLGYAVAVEELIGGVEVPERAQYIRVLMAELTRILSHMWAIGFLLNDLGAFFTPALYAIEERELILDIFEMTSGGRMMCNYMRFGGVAYDLLPESIPVIEDLVYDRLPRAIDELDGYLTENEIVMARCQDVGVIPADMAVNYSAAGPVLRGSGVEYDVRKADGYSIYDRFDFDVVTYPNGDVYDRYRVRIDEMRQSVRILEQVLGQMPEEGDIMGRRKAWQTRVPEGAVYGRVENPKGELGFYLVSTGGSNPYRYHVRSPSFINLTLLGEMCKGHKVADIVANLGSIDIILGEVDR